MTDYLAQVESTIENIRWLIKKESIEIEMPEGTSLGYLKGFIQFIDDSKLTFSEIIMGQKSQYRFHYMDSNNRLLKRWDSAPHHKEIKTFPFHLHTSSQILESNPLRLPEVLESIASTLIKLFS